MKKTYYFNRNIKSELIKYIFFTILIVVLNAVFYIDENEEFLIGIRVTILICSLIIISGYIYSAIFLIKRYKSKKGVLTFSGNEIEDTFIYVKIGHASLFRLTLPVKSIPYDCLGKVEFSDIYDVWHSTVCVENLDKSNVSFFVRLFLRIWGYNYGDCFCDIDHDEIVNNIW